MPNTSTVNVTHDAPDANKFRLKLIAGSGALERIRYSQWHMLSTMEEHTNNYNVIRLASLLAAFPRMGMVAIDFSHSQLAKVFGNVFKTSSPSRKSICLWERELSKFGLLNIPKHKASRPKTRVFTSLFWNLSRRGMKKISYPSLPVTWMPPNEKNTVTITQELTKSAETEIRAIDIDHEEQLQSRAPSQNKKFTRPPKHVCDGTPKGLDKFENSVGWWLFRNTRRGSYRRACLIFAEFLKMRESGEYYYTQLKRAWQECRDSERPGLVSDLIRNLAGSLPAQLPRVVVPDLCVLPDEPVPVNPEIAKLRIAMVFGGDYDGRYSDILAEYRRSTDERREEILTRLETI